MGHIYCMNCGTELDENARFCDKCGSPTLLGAGLVEAEGKAQVACPHCGALNDAGNAHCSSCGSSLSHDPARPSMPLAEDRAHERAYERPRDRVRQYAGAAGASHEQRKSTMVVGAVLAVAAVLILSGSLLLSGVLGGSGNGTEQQEQVTESDNTIDPALVGSAGIEAKDSLADYGWDELSIIAKEMTRQSSRDAAIEIAKEYNLVDSEGHMIPDATKEAELVGLGTVQMRLVDVYHDNLANGEGKAGMSFMGASLAFSHNMNDADENTGGWESSEMRLWLNATIFKALDEDLRNSIVYVDKLSDNAGYANDASSVTSTIDTLWLPSMVEIIGPIAWTWPSDPDNSDGYNAVANAEGSQYALFSEMGVEALAPNAGLVLEASEGPIEWWERSCSPSNNLKFRAVTVDGDPTGVKVASHDLGVCLGFCL